jgi:catechol 2,3-dioxygenase-like lactoylglutathione lyase family enzyme
MFDHVGIVAKDLIAAKNFYVAGLRALAVRLLQDNFKDAPPDTCFSSRRALR